MTARINCTYERCRDHADRVLVVHRTTGEWMTAVATCKGHTSTIISRVSREAQRGTKRDDWFVTELPIEWWDLSTLTEG